MTAQYEDWTDWAGDHPEQAEADLRRDRIRAAARQGIDLEALEAPDDPDAECEHADAYPNGYCADCGEPVPDFEPDDEQIEHDQLRKWAA